MKKWKWKLNIRRVDVERMLVLCASALVISLFVHRWMKAGPVRASIVGTAVGWVICFTGYTLGRAFIYSTPAYAVAKFPFQVLQTAVGSALALLLCWKCGLVRLYQKQFGEEA